MLLSVDVLLIPALPHTGRFSGFVSSKRSASNSVDERRFPSPADSASPVSHERVR